MEENKLSTLSGYFLRKARKEKKITGKELAKLMGSSQQQISRYENGITPLTIDLLYKFLLILEIDGASFIQKIFHEYANGSNNKEPAPATPPSLSQYIRHFIKDKNSATRDEIRYSNHNRKNLETYSVQLKPLNGAKIKRVNSKKE
ncbi:helix-turn-helix domain-containing protein [Providencia stuartii]|uniref:helix-turn-helix domain-containing protein n=1 Tax=Providencia stuartii TaxID=588 RepID=UPI0012B5D89C|nr:transcriptional regulator [Providencia stuartii]MTC21249.1 helix-turn-helix domain-containing protein [Providencia stuartii]